MIISCAVVGGSVDSVASKIHLILDVDGQVLSITLYTVHALHIVFHNSCDRMTDVPPRKPVPRLLSAFPDLFEVAFE